MKIFPIGHTPGKEAMRIGKRYFPPSDSGTFSGN